jgi:hypothetical protein
MLLHSPLLNIRAAAPTPGPDPLTNFCLDVQISSRKAAWWCLFPRIQFGQRNHLISRPLQLWQDGPQDSGCSYSITFAIVEDDDRPREDLRSDVPGDQPLVSRYGVKRVHGAQGTPVSLALRLNQHALVEPTGSWPEPLCCRRRPNYVIHRSEFLVELSRFEANAGIFTTEVIAEFTPFQPDPFQQWLIPYGVFADDEKSRMRAVLLKNIQNLGCDGWMRGIVDRKGDNLFLSSYEIKNAVTISGRKR